MGNRTLFPKAYFPYLSVIILSLRDSVGYNPQPQPVEHANAQGILNVRRVNIQYNTR
jgi:hypothetical protein